MQAHPDPFRELLDAHRLLEVLAEPGDRPGGAVGAAAHHHDVLEAGAVTRDEEACRRSVPKARLKIARGRENHLFIAQESHGA